jgi:ribosomal protein S18 acetylase RimI-like enzyme
VDRDELLAAFDEQLRRWPEPGGSDAGGLVIRKMSSTGWNGVTWAGIDEQNVDAAIASEIDRFAELGLAWEWKYYSYDRPGDLPERLLAAGFAPQPEEGLLVADIADLDLDVRVPPAIELHSVLDEEDVAALVAVNDAVFGSEHAALNRELGKELLDGMAAEPATAAAVLATRDGLPVGAGRVDFHHGTDFASLWGGGTVAAARGQGVFRAMVAHRATLAAARGFRYLRVDAASSSRAILGRLGFVEIATTTPYIHAGARRGDR